MRHFFRVNVAGQGNTLYAGSLRAGFRPQALDVVSPEVPAGYLCAQRRLDEAFAPRQPGWSLAMVRLDGRGWPVVAYAGQLVARDEGGRPGIVFVHGMELDKGEGLYPCVAGVLKGLSPGATRKLIRDLESLAAGKKDVAVEAFLRRTAGAVEALSSSGTRCGEDDLPDVGVIEHDCAGAAPVAWLTMAAVQGRADPPWQVYDRPGKSGNTQTQVHPHRGKSVAASELMLPSARPPVRSAGPVRAAAPPSAKANARGVRPLGIKLLLGAMLALVLVTATWVGMEALARTRLENTVVELNEELVRQREQAHEVREQARRAESEAALQTKRADENAAAVKRAEAGADDWKRKAQEHEQRAAANADEAARRAAEVALERQRADRYLRFLRDLSLLGQDLALVSQEEVTVQASATLGLVSPTIPPVVAARIAALDVPVLYGLALSPDGRRMATCCGGAVKLWDAAAGKKLLDLPRLHTGAVRGVAFSPDGKYLASGGNDRTARIWDTSTGREVIPLRRHNDTVTGVAFRPDGRYLATSSDDGTVRIWDWSTGKAVVLPLGNIGKDSAVTFSPDGKFLAGGGEGGTIKLWEANTWKDVATLKGHADKVTSLAFSPGGTYLASGSRDKTVRLWDMAYPGPPVGLEMRALGGHRDAVIGVAFSPDGKRLVSASRDGVVRVWGGTFTRAAHP
jgi:hypothetical protein